MPLLRGRAAPEVGRTRTKVQRYRCCGCFKTYSGRSGNSIGRIHRPDLFIHIQNVNSLHACYGKFIKPLCGPATKNIDGYIRRFEARLAGMRPSGDRPRIVDRVHRRSLLQALFGRQVSY
jgi:hypothetical protein